MPLDTSIPLKTTNIDLSPGLNSLAGAFRYREQQQERGEDRAMKREEFDLRKGEIEANKELRDIQMANAKFGQLDKIQQYRLRNATISAAQFNGFIEAGDIAGGENFLQTLRGQIAQTNELVPGLLDTTALDQAMGMLKAGDIEGLKKGNKEAIKLGQMLGMLQKPEKKTTFTPVYDSKGQIVAQKNEQTGEVKSDPRAKEQKTVDLSPDDIKGLGLPRGTVAQKKADGTLSIVFKPERDSTGNARAQKIRSLISQGMEPDDAANIVDGFTKIEIVPETGNARLINMRDKSVKEIPIGGDAPRRADIPEDQKLFSLVEDATGLQSGVLSVTARVPGTEPTATEKKVLNARNQFQMFSNEVARGLVNNSRFPVAEREAVLSAIDISPAVFDNPPAMRVRLQSASRFLGTRFQQADRDAKDTSLPEKIRSEQAQNAATIKNAIDRIGSQAVDINKEIGQMTPDQLRAMIKGMSTAELNAMDDKTRSRIAKALK